MPGESYNTENQNQPTETQWDTLAQEAPFQDNSINQAEQPSDKESTRDLGDEVQETLSTMDERTRDYIWQLGSNIYNIFTDSTQPEDKKFAKDFVAAFNQALASDKLKGAYLDATGTLHIGDDADKSRAFDVEQDLENGDAHYLPEDSTLRPQESELSEEELQKNGTMDQRTKRYLWNFVKNIDTILDKEAAATTLDHFNAATKNGLFKDAYLDDMGTLRDGKVAAEYRGYDARTLLAERDPQHLIENFAYYTEKVGATPEDILDTILDYKEIYTTEDDGSERHVGDFVHGMSEADFVKKLRQRNIRNWTIKNDGLETAINNIDTFLDEGKMTLADFARRMPSTIKESFRFSSDKYPQFLKKIFEHSRSLQETTDVINALEPPYGRDPLEMRYRQLTEPTELSKDRIFYNNAGDLVTYAELLQEEGVLPQDYIESML